MIGRLLKPKNPWEKKSYSQCGEDLIVQFVFDNLSIKNPSYIDIGAHHPFNLSNTALFYEQGSRGINIEPDPILFKEFLLHRKSDTNLNIGISDKSSIQDFYVMNAPTLNTFSKVEADKYSKEGDFYVKEVVKINTSELSGILEKHTQGIFPDFLSIDAEGIDELVIRSIDFNSNFPKIICVETISFSMTGNGTKNYELISYLQNNGYLLYADTYINSIFVRKNLWIR